MTGTHKRERERRAHTKRPRPSISQVNMVLLLDGGVGHTWKKRHGDASFLGGALACEADPDGVAAVHEEFYKAGADIATTNSFVATPHHAGDRALPLVTAAARCARAAALRNVQPLPAMRLVAGSLPPLGECYAVRRDQSNEDVQVYEQLAFALGDEKVDVLIAETLTHSSEAANIIAGVKMASIRRGYRVPLWLVFTLADDTTARLRGGERLSVAIQRALDAADGTGVLLAGVGVNCCAPDAIDAALQDVVDAVAGREQANTSKRPYEVIAYANAFERTTSEWLRSEGRPDCCSRPCVGRAGEYVDGVMTPEAYAKRAAAWVRMGATVVGGCCGTTPAHTAACRVLLTRQRRQSRIFGYLTLLFLAVALLAAALGPARWSLLLAR